jgi:hypothetical protein
MSMAMIMAGLSLVDFRFDCRPGAKFGRRGQSP